LRLVSPPGTLHRHRPTPEKVFHSPISCWTAAPSNLGHGRGLLRLRATHRPCLPRRRSPRPPWFASLPRLRSPNLRQHHAKCSIAQMQGEPPTSRSSNRELCGRFLGDYLDVAPSLPSLRVGPSRGTWKFHHTRPRAPPPFHALVGPTTATCVPRPTRLWTDYTRPSPPPSRAISLFEVFDPNQAVAGAHGQAGNAQSEYLQLSRITQGLL